jgi:transcriptional regulator with XRE-family HTH domain
MEMQINATLIKQYREQRAWSQNQLADVAGLSMRTIQRIEASGTASYDSVQALASALDCTVEQLRFDPTLGSVEIKQSPKLGRWRTLGSFTMGAVITLAGFLLLTQVHAEQILMDVSYSIDGQTPRDFTLANQLRQEAEFNIEERFRVIVIPELLENGNIRLTMNVFERRDGKDNLISEPKIITANQQRATIIVNHQQDNELAVDITPHYGIL